MTSAEGLHAQTHKLRWSIYPSTQDRAPYHTHLLWHLCVCGQLVQRDHETAPDTFDRRHGDADVNNLLFSIGGVLTPSGRSGSAVSRDAPVTSIWPPPLLPRLLLTFSIHVIVKHLGDKTSFDLTFLGVGTRWGWHFWESLIGSSVLTSTQFSLQPWCGEQNVSLVHSGWLPTS